jgi:hypothetical protein
VNTETTTVGDVSINVGHQTTVVGRAEALIENLIGVMQHVELIVM